MYNKENMTRLVEMAKALQKYQRKTSRLDISSESDKVRRQVSTMLFQFTNFAHALYEADCNSRLAEHEMRPAKEKARYAKQAAIELREMQKADEKFELLEAELDGESLPNSTHTRPVFASVPRAVFPTMHQSAAKKPAAKKTPVVKKATPKKATTAKKKLGANKAMVSKKTAAKKKV